MKKVLSLLLVVLVLIGNVALVSCDYEIIIQKKTTATTTTTREATREDIFCKITREWSSDGKSCVCTLELQANEKIQGLVLEFTLETNDGKVIHQSTAEMGNVVPGNQYSWQLYLSQEELQAFDGYKIKVVGGVVVP